MQASLGDPFDCFFRPLTGPSFTPYPDATLAPIWTASMSLPKAYVIETSGEALKRRPVFASLRVVATPSGRQLEVTQEGRTLVFELDAAQSAEIAAQLA